MITSFPKIFEARAYSDERIQALRSGIDEIQSGNEDLAVVAVGSLARREASGESDLDYFLVYGDVEPGEKLIKALDDKILELGFKPPAVSGAFAKAVSKSELLSKLGGNGESNDDLTRRMLLLLESEWLYGKEIFEGLITEIVHVYIGEKITQHQMARFFLNDLIRYYRTICVDFEYKTVTAGKSWGDRNIKLMFSRKLLYFSGVLAAAETVQSSGDFKRTELIRLLRLNPVDRVLDVCGEDSRRVLLKYDKFLGWLSDPDKRRLLRETLADRETHTNEFRSMKNLGHHFTWDVDALLKRRYSSTHPIHQAIFL